MKKDKKNKFPWDLLFLSVYIAFLPVAHVATVQSVSSVLFVIYVIVKYKHTFSLEPLKKFKSLWIAFAVYTFLAFLSLFFTPDKIETLKEIKGELLEHLFFLIIFFFYAINIDEKRFRRILGIIFFVLFVHNIINIIIWTKHGGWPFRAGGFLDTPGGERFGIWITYSLSLAISLFYVNKIAAFFLLILSLLSSIANQVRATFLGILFVILFYVFVFNKKRIVKYITSVCIILAGILFYSFSSKLPPRYNIKSVLYNLHLVVILPPHEFNKISIDPSIYERLSMWKSALLYRFKHPFVPQYFGRFLYKKSILKEFEGNPQNIPVHLYPQVHNDYIGTLHALGIFGLITFLYIFYFKLKISYRLFQLGENIYEKAFGIFVFLGTIGYMMSIMFGSFFGDSEARFFFLLYGLLLGRFYHLDKKAEVV